MIISECLSEWCEEWFLFLVLSSDDCRFMEQFKSKIGVNIPELREAESWTYVIICRESLNLVLMNEKIYWLKQLRGNKPNMKFRFFEVFRSRFVIEAKFYASLRKSPLPRIAVCNWATRQISHVIELELKISGKLGKYIS